jgi:hypothetical protein
MGEIMRQEIDPKQLFRTRLTSFVQSLNTYTCSDDKQWTVKGFIDIYKNIYTISGDTKIVSKILEIHIFPKLLEFASQNNYKLVLADHQNYYPDLSFVDGTDENVIFAVDLKTTYRNPGYPGHCNGFTLGSHGEYFTNRESKKNIQFPYNKYKGHFCLGIIYTRTASEDIDETKIYSIDKLRSITSVVVDFQFFVCEKWEIASDKSGSGNTANIGSIDNIDDIIECNGMFKYLGEHIFDDYWMNYGKIMITDDAGKQKKISNLIEFLAYRGLDPKMINNKRSKRKVKSIK